MSGDRTLPLWDDPEPASPTLERPAAERQPAEDAPLPERMRPRTLDEMVGQRPLVGPDGTLRRLLAVGHLPNLILHGPPGSGKTTLARVIAGAVDATFVPFNATGEGVPRLREIVAAAETRQRAGRRTLLFVDEIHRLNKGQQDFLLPFLESGLLTLIGATTEHPGFEINAALLSRSRVLVLEPLSVNDLKALVRRALADPGRGLGGTVRLSDAAEAALLEGAAGDARQALAALETAAELTDRGGEIDEATVREALQRPVPRYDTSLRYEMLSAFHKSLRASAPDAALYWAMWMIQGGEDPHTLFRRLVAAAYEDVGLADPRAGMIAVAAMQAWERMGAPEGYLPLANAVVYVATAPKSNRAYTALHAASAAAEEHSEAPVPLALRNATTALMREWGYGEGYRYAHDAESGYMPLQCLPDALADSRFYDPTERGFEADIARLMRERDNA